MKKLGILAVLAVCCGLSLAAQALPNEVILVNDPYPPYVMPEGDKLGPGIDMEIAVKALSNLGIKTTIQLVPFKRALTMLEGGQADLTTTLSFREDRDAYLLWSAPYRSSTKYIFFTPKASAFAPKTLEDLKGKTVGVIRGFTYPTVFSDNAAIIKSEAPDTVSLINMLLSKRFDAIIVNSIVGRFDLTSTGKIADVKQAPYELSSPDAKGTVMGFSKVKKLEGLRDAFDKELKKMLADGTVTRIEKKYLD